MRLISIILCSVLLCGCSCRFHVCVETDYKTICDHCKKKPLVTYRPQDHKPTGIKIIDRSFATVIA